MNEETYQVPLSERECLQLVQRITNDLSAVNTRPTIISRWLTMGVSPFAEKIRKERGKQTRVEQWLDEQLETGEPIPVYAFDKRYSQSFYEAFLVSVRRGSITVRLDDGIPARRFMAFCSRLEKELSIYRETNQVGSELDNSMLFSCFPTSFESTVPSNTVVDVHPRIYDIIRSQIANAGLSPATEKIANQLLSLSHPANGHVTLSHSNIKTVTGISLSRLRYHLGKLQAHDLIHYAIKNHIYVTFLAWAETKEGARRCVPCDHSRAPTESTSSINGTQIDESDHTYAENARGYAIFDHGCAVSPSIDMIDRSNLVNPNDLSIDITRQPDTRVERSNIEWRKKILRKIGILSQKTIDTLANENDEEALWRAYFSARKNPGKCTIAQATASRLMGKFNGWQNEIPTNQQKGEDELYLEFHPEFAAQIEHQEQERANQNQQYLADIEQKREAEAIRQMQAQAVLEARFGAKDSERWKVHVALCNQLQRELDQAQWHIVIEGDCVFITTDDATESHWLQQAKGTLHRILKCVLGRPVRLNVNGNWE